MSRDSLMLNVLIYNKDDHCTVVMAGMARCTVVMAGMAYYTPVIECMEYCG